MKESRDILHVADGLAEALAAMIVVLMQRLGTSQAAFTEAEMMAAAELVDGGKVPVHFRVEGDRVESLTVEIQP